MAGAVGGTAGCAGCWLCAGAAGFVDCCVCVCVGDEVCGDCVGVCCCGGLLAEGAGCCVVCVVEADDCRDAEAGDAPSPSRAAVFDTTATNGTGDGEGEGSSLFGEDYAGCAASCFGFFAWSLPKIEPEKFCGGVCSPCFLFEVCCAGSGEYVRPRTSATAKALKKELCLRLIMMLTPDN